MRLHAHGQKGNQVQALTLNSLFHLARGGYRGGGQAAPVVAVTGKNTSGGALVRGDVVVIDRTNMTVDLICFTTSTGGNDIDVLGMVMEPIGIDGIGRVQIWGPTKDLKVDGTTDIAVGDMLGTFTTAKIAQKSTTGGRFARALEAYTANNSSGVIDAFIANINMQSFTTE